MAGSVNKVIILGNLGQDPECRTFPNGGKVVNLSVATSEKWTVKDTGEKKERTEWHKVVILNEPLCKIAEQYLKKGSKVYIEGQLETRKWTDQSGVEKYTTEIVLRPYNGAIVLLDRQEGDRSRGQDENTYDNGRTAGGYEDTQAGAAGPDMDDSIPF